MKIINITSIILFVSFSSFAGVRDSFVEVTGVIKKYDDKKIWIEKNKEKIVIPRLKEFEKRLKFTGEQRFFIDSDVYARFIKKMN